MLPRWQPRQRQRQQPRLGGHDGRRQRSAAYPFTADPPYVYVSKVKNLLTGLPATADDINQVTTATDPRAALKSLIDQWMGTTEYTGKMMTFFEQAFQQTQISQADFVELIPNQGTIGTSQETNLLIQNVKEMFARTVQQLIANGQPLNAAFTTNTFMMTPPLMELIAFMDQNQVDDADNVVDKFAQTFPGNITIQDNDPSVTYAMTIDTTPGNKYFMNWYYPGVDTLQPNEPAPTCQSQVRTYKASAHTVHFLMYGQLDVLRFGKGPSGACQIYSGNNNSIFANADFDDWKMVTIRQPNNRESTTNFWDANYLKMKSTTTLVVNTPRVGFYTTPAFQANWPTNTSNMMRDDEPVVHRGPRRSGRRQGHRRTPARIRRVSTEAARVGKALRA